MTSQTGVQALKSKLAINPAALLPNSHRIADDTDPIWASLDGLDPNNPADAEVLLKVAQDMRTQVQTLTRLQKELIANNKALRADIDLYSRITLPHAVMSKFDRDTSSSGLNDLNELRRVLHKQNDSGTWHKVEEPKKPTATEELDMKKSQGVDKIFRSGWMYKEGNVIRNWKRRLFILWGSSIEYYAKRSDEKPKGTIPLDTCKISPVQSRPGVSRPCIEIIFSKEARKWRFTSEILSDNKRWFAAINSRIVTLAYVHRCKQAKKEPDAAVLEFLNTVPPNSPTLDEVDDDGEKVRSSSHSYANHPTETWPPSHPLNLSGRQLSLDTVSVVARILSDSDTCPGGGVSMLDLSRTGLTSLELEVISNALVSSDFNVATRAERKQETDAGSNELAPEYLPLEQHAVSSINFSGNTLVDKKDSKNASVISLSRVLMVNTMLTELILDDCHLGDEGAIILAAALPERACTLRRLVLSRNGITSKGGVVLADALVAGMVETKLRLDKAKDNFATMPVPRSDDKPAPAEPKEPHRPRIIGNPTRMHTLAHLQLSHNEIGDDGGKALAKLFTVPTTSLIHVNLSHNLIGDDGMVPIAEAIAKNTRLLTLDVSHNPISEDKPRAATALTHMAEVNRSLVELKFLNHTLTDVTLNSMRLLTEFGFDNTHVRKPKPPV